MYDSRACSLDPLGEQNPRSVIGRGMEEGNQPDIRERPRFHDNLVSTGRTLTMSTMLSVNCPMSASGSRSRTGRARLHRPAL